MNYEYDENIIKNALSTVEIPEYNIIPEVDKKIKEQKSHMNFKRIVAAVLAVCLCLMFSVGLVAAAIPNFKKLLFFVASDIALMLQPVEISSEDNGIKMEVVAAMNDDEMAVIYLTMQDLTGNRIDKTLDIYDYSLTGMHAFNCQIVNYDEITKTATLRMQANGGEKLDGKKVKFRIDSFLSDKLIFDAVETGINLLDIASANVSQTVPLDMNNIPGGGGSLFEEFKEQGIVKVLKADQMKHSLPGIEFMYISNIGYIDGRLHIQTKWVGEGIDDHGYFYFVNTAGDKINISASNIYFGTDESGDTKYGNDYVEYIFDVNNLNLNEIKLMGFFVSNGNYTTGNWEVAFKIQSVGQQKQTDCNIKFDTWTVTSISVSPMGITLTGSGENKEPQSITVSANMTDGSVQTFESVRSFSDNGKVKIKFTSSLPLDVSKVQSVTVDGIEINNKN